MIVRKVLSCLVPVYIRKQIRNFWILAVKYGQYRSIKLQQCENENGRGIPWYVYPAIEYLDSLDFSGLTVLEFGSGTGSYWWAERAKHVLSVEHNEDWFKKAAKEKLLNNQSIVLAMEAEQYAQAGSGKKFDIVIIDGEYRHRCATVVKSILNEKGIVLLDNSDWYPDTAKYLRENLDLIQVDFHGFGPINNYTWTTSLFFTRSVKLKAKTSRLPNYSLGAIKQSTDGDA